MADLLIRDVDDTIVRALRHRAIVHGRSEEAEHRAMLASALLFTPCRSLAEHLSALPLVGWDGDFAREPGSNGVTDPCGEGACT
ncbi:DNA-binding protein [Cyanobium sp. AMD-g]|uniref:FitA-like ribbon-helix-helix domain-containing protein n=1 Tax=Cyanobium sp. AMD-g TaxID=2823699 RepID=UPI0020CCE1D5|nr:DNA-binding protein [Cyanobium sp. AMD-g]MCP9931750.1 DNA-binding protein [Cyanobium sp. AMD-g]